MTFPFTIVSTPNANDDPADDVNDMRQNYLNIGGLIDVDHVPAGTNPGAGFHDRVTYFGNNVPVAPTQGSTPISSAYTVNGVADATNVQNVYKNFVGVFPLSAIRAFGTFITLPDPTSPAVTVPTSWYNVSSITHANLNTYVVTFPPGIIVQTAAKPTVFIYASFNTNSSSLQSNPSYTLGVNTLTITVQDKNAGATLFNTVNFVVLQF